MVKKEEDGRVAGLEGYLYVYMLSLLIIEGKESVKA